MLAQGVNPRCSTRVATLDLRHACGHASPQRGSNVSAQGIALGLRRPTPKSPVGAQQTINPKRTVHQTRDDGDPRTSETLPGTSSSDDALPVARCTAAHVLPATRSRKMPRIRFAYGTPQTPPHRVLIHFDDPFFTSSTTLHSALFLDNTNNAWT